MMPAPAAGTPAPATLVVDNLAPATTEKHLFDIFRSVGDVVSVYIARRPSDGASLLYAHVAYGRPVDAERALETLNGVVIEDRACRIAWDMRPRPAASGAGNVIITNLPETVTSEALCAAFAPYGPLLSCKVVPCDPATATALGVVRFTAQDAVARAAASVHDIRTALNAPHGVLSHFERREAVDTDPEDTFTTCYVKHLHKRRADDEVHNFCSAYGCVDSLRVLRDDDGTSRGIAYVAFADHAGAMNFVDAANGTAPAGIVEDGQTLYVARHQHKLEREHSLKQVMRASTAEGRHLGMLRVMQLAESTTSEDLQSLFSPFGEVVSARVMCDPTTLASQGYGFVCFADDRDARRAAEVMTERGLVVEQVGGDTGKPLIPPVVDGSYGAAPRHVPVPHAAAGAPRGPSAGAGATWCSASGDEGLGPPPVADPLGDELYAHVARLAPQHAVGKVTGMLLELGGEEARALLASPDALQARVQDALELLRHRWHQATRSG